MDMQKAKFIVWLIAGICILATGNITRTAYGVLLLCYLLEVSKNADNERND